MDSRSLPPSDSSPPDRSSVLPEGSTVQRRRMENQTPTSDEIVGDPPNDQSESILLDASELEILDDAPRHLDEFSEGAATVIRGGSSRSRVSETRSDRAAMRDLLNERRDSSHPSHRPATPASITRDLRGQRLNHFLLLDQIGGGGMGAVFRARDEQLGRTVAVKVIPFAADDPDLQRRFRNEAQSAAKLDHPLIARVFEVGNDGPWHYIVFEYVDGANIRDMVASNGPLSRDEALYFTIQLAEAIGHASHRGIVHRDIKPSNVIVTADGSVKLVDMGLARSDNFDTSEDLTASGVTLGTFDYISPEQARDPRLADIRSDLYSLGCTLFYMLTGAPPFPGGTMLQKLLSHGNAAIPDIRGQRTDASADLAAVLTKMLAKLPEDRYQRSETLIADLRELAARENLPRSRGVSVVTLEDDDHRETMRRLRRHLPWMVAGSLLIVSAAAVEIFSMQTRREFSQNLSATVSPDAVESTVPRATPLARPVDASNRSTRLPGENPSVFAGGSSGQSMADGQSMAGAADRGTGTAGTGSTGTGSAGTGTAGPGEIAGDRAGVDVDESPTAIDELVASANPADEDPAMELPFIDGDLSGEVASIVDRATVGSMADLSGMGTSSTENDSSRSVSTDPPSLQNVPLPPGLINSTDATGGSAISVAPTRPGSDGQVIPEDQIAAGVLGAEKSAASNQVIPPGMLPETVRIDPLTGEPVSSPSELVSPWSDESLMQSSVFRDAAGISNSIVPNQLPTSPLPTPSLIEVVTFDALRDPLRREQAARGGVQLVTSLDEALRQAERRQIDRIDLSVPELVSDPVVIPRSDLILSSNMPGGTAIVFRSSSEVDMQRSEMMTIGSHRIEMSGLHFYWSVPATETDGGAMFAINDNRRVRLSDCSVTIDNASRRDDVQAFSVVTDPEHLMPLQDELSGAVSYGAMGAPGAFPLVSIELSNVIVRGQITMLRLDVAAELQLSWENGLLAVSRRMIEMGGALQRPRPSSPSVRLSLQQLTTITPKGMMQMRMGVSAPYPIAIERRAEECVFVVDPGVPHIELTGIPRVDRDDIWVRLRGAGNAYETDTTLDDPMLLIRDELGQTRSTSMSDILDNSPSWMDERTPRWAVRWSEPFPESTPSSWWTPREFRQDGSVVGGFQERSLPRLPMEQSFDFPPTS